MLHQYLKLFEMLFLALVFSFLGICQPFPQEVFKTLQALQPPSLQLNQTLRVEPSNSISTRIIKGTEVTPHSQAYMAYILFVGTQYQWVCGGSLISENCVLTAGHCTSGALWAAVALGVHNTSITESTQQVITSYTLITHEDYDSSTINADIGLIKLNESVTLTSAVQPISILSSEEAKESLVGQTVTIYGWGLTNGNDTDGSDVLMGVNTTVAADSECMIYNVYNSNIQLCTSGTQGEGSCNGDSGGPLVSDQGKVVGIVSYGVENCLQGYPSVFTKVGSYLDWIAQNGTAPKASNFISILFLAFCLVLYSSNYRY